MNLNFALASSRIPFILFATYVLVGCTSTVVSNSSVEWVAPALQPSLSLSTVDTGTLVVKRDSGGALFMRGCKHRISIDGAPFVDLMPGQGTKVFVRPGKHVIDLSFTAEVCNSGESAVAIDVAQGQPTFLRTTTSPDEKSLLIPSAN